MLDDMAEHLRESWHLHIKPSSRSCLVPKGSSDVSVDPERWPQVDTMPALGHIIADDGSPMPCWRECSKKAWKAFYANAKKGRDGGAGLQLTLRSLQTSVASVINFRNTRWPVGKTICKQIDICQRKMIAALQRVPPYPYEDPAHYNRRRGKEAAKLAEQHGRWSNKYMQRVIDWHRHLQRHQGIHYWPSALYSYHGEDWLRNQRLIAGSTSLFAGRTGTRAQPGPVVTRWEDGYRAAEKFLFPTKPTH